MLTTHMSAASGALAWMAIEWVRFGKPSGLGLITGMVAGLGMIAPAAGFVSPLGGVAIGLVAGSMCFSTLHWIKRKLQIDDTLDVFAIHGVGGIVGALLTAAFAAKNLGGIGTVAENGFPGQLWAQFVAVVSVLAWSGGISFIVLKLLDKTVGLRVSQMEETEGLDIAQHNEHGYNL